MVTARALAVRWAKQLAQFSIRGISSAGEHLPGRQGVSGSNPLCSTQKIELRSGTAAPWGAAVWCLRSPWTTIWTTIGTTRGGSRRTPGPGWQPRPKSTGSIGSLGDHNCDAWNCGPRPDGGWVPGLHQAIRRVNSGSPGAELSGGARQAVESHLDPGVGAQQLVVGQLTVAEMEPERQPLKGVRARDSGRSVPAGPGGSRRLEKRDRQRCCLCGDA
jgi:hypothetical protein